MGEFDLIERFFKQKAAPTPANQAQTATNSIVLGIGDDCALLQPAPGMQLAVSTDMLVEGRHFFADVDPEALGHKALAVNLSDLAAMGAEPLAFTLALALPPERAADDAWMGAFARGLFALADEHRCTLIGGDTTAGPLNICITVFGQVPVGQALRRDGAKPGDDIWVSGTLGEARLALLALQGQLAVPPEPLAALRQRLERPTPRVALGMALRGVASSAMDLSDGLAGDLSHILQASQVGAVVETRALVAMMSLHTQCHDFNLDGKIDTLVTHLLTGGDDYELIFTVAERYRGAIATIAATHGVTLTRIGGIEDGHALWLQDANGHRATARAVRSFDHFA